MTIVSIKIYLHVKDILQKMLSETTSHICRWLTVCLPCEKVAPQGLMTAA